MVPVAAAVAEVLAAAAVEEVEEENTTVIMVVGAAAAESVVVIAAAAVAVLTVEEEATDLAADVEGENGSTKTVVVLTRTAGHPSVRAATARPTEARARRTDFMIAVDDRQQGGGDVKGFF